MLSTALLNGKLWCQRNEEGAARGKVEVEGEGGAGERQEKRVEEGEMRLVEGWEQVQEVRKKTRTRWANMGDVVRHCRPQSASYRNVNRQLRGQVITGMRLNGTPLALPAKRPR